jgi:nucleotide-binding universal stress UspA family protein
MITIERILCPVDLSEESTEALRYAVALTRTYGAKLYLCYCAENSSVKNSPLSAEAKEKIERTFANSIIRHLGHADFGRIDWKGIIVENGNHPAEAITQEAAERGVNLIVMRSRRRPHRAALLGSVAEAVCRTAPCPVLVTHPREREWVGASTGEINLRRVLVAYDFSDDSERALSNALSLAEEYKAELHLLHVLSTQTMDGPEIAWMPMGAECAYHQASRRLQTAVTGYAHLRCKVVHAVRWGKPYQEVLAYAGENGVDLVCMGAHGKHFGAGALFGSNVDRVLRQAPCPILVARSLKPSFSFVSSRS